MLQVLKLFVASRNAAIKEVHFPAELGPSYVYATPDAIHGAVNKFLGIEASGGPRGSLEAKRRARAPESRRARSRSSAEAGRSPISQAEAARQRRPGAGARSRRSSRAKSVARKVSAGFPVFYPTRLPSEAHYVESNSYEHVQDPRVYHLRTPTASATAPTGWSPSCDSPTESTTSACRGSRAGRTRRSSTTRAKRGRSTAANTSIFVDGDRITHGRLAPRRQQLLGLQRPAEDADQRPDDRDRALGQGEDPEQEAEERGGRSDERRAESRSG